MRRHNKTVFNLKTITYTVGLYQHGQWLAKQYRAWNELLGSGSDGAACVHMCSNCIINNVDISVSLSFT